MKKRLSLALLTLLGLVFSIFPEGTISAQTPKHVVLQLRWDNQFQFAGYYAADWQGFYREEGLEVEIRPALTTDGTILSATNEVAAGRADFGIGAADILMALDQGADLRVAATVFQQSAARFYLKETTPYASLADLLHLRVARKVNDLIDVELQAMLQNEGIDPALVAPYPHQPGIDHLLSDQVQVLPGYNMTIPYFADKAEAALKEITPASYGIDFYGDSLFTTGTLVDRDPDLVERFVRASLRGWEFALQHPEEVAGDISTRFDRIDRVDDVVAFNHFQIDAVQQLTLYPVVDIGHTNPRRWGEMNEVLRGLGIVQRELDPDTFVFDPAAARTAREARYRGYLNIAVGVILLASILGLGWLVSTRRLVRQRTRSLQEQLEGRRQAEEALRLNEVKYRSLVDNLTQGIWHIDADGRTTFANPAMAAMLGYDAEEMIGMHLFEFMDARGVELAERYLASRKAGVEERHDFEFLRKDGARVIASLNTGPILDQHGNYVGAIAGIQDITELRHATEALAQSESRFRNLFRSAPIPAFVWKAVKGDITLIDVNAAAETMTFGGARSFLGLTAHQLYADRPDLIERFHSCLEHKETIVYETNYQTRGSNENLIVVFTFACVSPELILLHTEDVTERRNAEAAIRNERAKILGLIENTDGVIWSIDRECRLITSNSRFRRDLQRRLGHEPAMGESIFTSLARDDRTEEWRTHLARALRGEHFSVEAERRTETSHNWMEYRLSPIRNASGEITGATVYGRDITERKQAEQERAALQAQLLQAQKMEAIGRLAGGIAHDFNNMLAVILMRTELSLGLVDAEKSLSRNLTSIQDAAQRSADLVRQLLGFARKQVITPAALNLNETIKKTLPMLSKLIGEEIKLTWLPGDDLWNVKMDPSQVDQILTNLCVNARDAIPGVGTVTVATENLIVGQDSVGPGSTVRAGEYVALSVTDDGSGMDQDVLSKIFEPFFTTKTLGKGTGLGLATVEGIVHQNRGEIQVISELGKGTTFRVLIPRYVEAPMPADTPAPAPLIAGHGETILLVEDEVSVLEMASEALHSLGYSILSAATPGEAIELAQASNATIDLLLTDIVMPEMNGRELAERVSSLQPGMKTIYVSGYPSDHVSERGVLADGRNFLQKPYTLHDLATAVREALKLAHTPYRQPG